MLSNQEIVVKPSGKDCMPAIGITYLASKTESLEERGYSVDVRMSPPYVVWQGIAVMLPFYTALSGGHFAGEGLKYLTERFL